MISSSSTICICKHFLFLYYLRSPTSHCKTTLTFIIGKSQCASSTRKYAATVATTPCDFYRSKSFSSFFKHLLHLLILTPSSSLLRPVLQTGCFPPPIPFRSDGPKRACHHDTQNVFQAKEQQIVGNGRNTTGGRPKQGVQHPARCNVPPERVQL